MTHFELAKEALRKGIFKTKEQADKWADGVERLKQSGATGLYNFREKQLKDKIRSKR